MAETGTKTLQAPVQISAADILEAFRQQPVALQEAQRKVDRERALASAAEFDSWKHIRSLAGVESCDSFLYQEDTGQVDEKTRLPIIKTVLRAVVKLKNGKEVTAEAHAQAYLDKLITERVHAALGINATQERIHKPWVPLAKVMAAGG